MVWRPLAGRSLSGRPIGGRLLGRIDRTLAPGEGVGGFSPLSLFAGGEEGVWYDPSDLSTLWQDSARTTPVTADGDPVGCIDDKSGNGNHAIQASGTSRPLYKTSGGLHWLQFDGSNDSLATSAIDFTGTDKISAFSGVRKLSDVAVGMVVELGIGSAVGSFSIYAPGSAGAATFGSNLKGTAEVGYGMTATAAPYSAVVSSLLDISAAARADEIKPRLNGVLTQSSGFGTNAGTGNFGNHALNLGSRNGASFRYNGSIYSLIVLGRAATDAEITNAERYAATKTGVTL